MTTRAAVRCMLTKMWWLRQKRRRQTKCQGAARVLRQGCLAPTVQRLTWSKYHDCLSEQSRPRSSVLSASFRIMTRQTTVMVYGADFYFIFIVQLMAGVGEVTLGS